MPLPNTKIELLNNLDRATKSLTPSLMRLNHNMNEIATSKVTFLAVTLLLTKLDGAACLSVGKN
jgi:hypothetical protein